MTGRIGRLRRRSEYLRVAAEGRKTSQNGVVVQARRCAAGDRHTDPDARLWLGITVSRKVGKAVERNRARRRLRAAAAEVLDRTAAAGHDYVLIGRRATLTRAWPALLSDLEAALGRLGAIRDDASDDDASDDDAPGRGDQRPRNEPPRDDRPADQPPPEHR